MNKTNEQIALNSARKAFLTLFPNPSDAIEFENQVLSVGRSFLPASAILVLEGATPTTEYYRFLRDQAVKSSNDAQD